MFDSKVNVLWVVVMVSDELVMISASSTQRLLLWMLDTTLLLFFRRVGVVALPFKLLVIYLDSGAANMKQTNTHIHPPVSFMFFVFSFNIAKQTFYFFSEILLFYVLYLAHQTHGIAIKRKLTVRNVIRAG